MSYELLKDLPTVKAGTIGYKQYEGCISFDDEYHFKELLCKSKPDWFKPISHEFKVGDIVVGNCKGKEYIDKIWKIDEDHRIEVIDCGVFFIKDDNVRLATVSEVIKYYEDRLNSISKKYSELKKQHSLYFSYILDNNILIGNKFVYTDEDKNESLDTIFIIEGYGWNKNRDQLTIIYKEYKTEYANCSFMYINDFLQDCKILNNESNTNSNN